MRSATIAVGLAALITGGGVGYAFLRAAASDGRSVRAVSSVRKAALPKQPFIHVDDLAAARETHLGEFLLRGVVAGINKSERMFGVIDLREFKACGVVTCAKNTLPVRYAGTLPQPKTIVDITGTVMRNERGLVIQASHVETRS